MSSDKKKAKSLPTAAEDALNTTGVSDIAMMICIDKNGKQHVLKGKNVENDSNNTFPIKTKEIQEITAMSVVKYSGSNCITYVLGGTSYSICW